MKRQFIEEQFLHEGKPVIAISKLKYAFANAKDLAEFDLVNGDEVEQVRGNWCVEFIHSGCFSEKGHWTLQKCDANNMTENKCPVWLFQERRT